jgi:ribosomal protein S13
MIDKPTRIGNTELYTTRVLNMSVAKYYGVLKQYNELVVEARELNKKELEKNGEKAELNLYKSIKYNLNLMVLEKILKDKTKEEVKNIFIAYLNKMKRIIK